MTEPILYSFRRCPYAMRARMALAISETAHEIREVKLREKPAEMLTASPKGTVPVLVLPDGHVIDESLDVMRWALAQSDPEGWLNGTREDLITANDGPFKHHLDRYKYSTRHETDPAEHRAACLAILQALDAQLSRSEFLHGASRGMSDIAIMPFVRQFAATDRKWFEAQDIPHLRRWLDGLLQSDLFQQIMVKRGQWRAATG